VLVLALGGCYAPTVARERTYHPSDSDLSITRIHHASLIVDFSGTRILVDPWFSPTPPLGPRETIGLAPDKLPSVRGILITHDHSDHFDKDTLRSYPAKDVRVVARRGLGEPIRRMGYGDVVEVEDWEQTQIGNVIVTAVPADHQVPESGFVLQADSVTAYVAGDTRFDRKQFAAIAGAFPDISVAVLPVGGIRVIGFPLDMGPEDAARAAAMLRPRRVIPYHYGLTGPFPFVLPDSSAPEEFVAAMRERPATATIPVVVLQPGESWHYYR
jgi:L-ascorbate metabolism protein UlaG (beta-lactamase superfamily)